MKKYLILIIVGLLGCNCLNKPKSRNVVQKNKTIKNYQPLKYFNGDSLKYLNQNFVNEKSEFSGKTLNVFLDRLEIPVSTYITSPGYPPNSDYYSINLKFYNNAEIQEKIREKQNPMILLIQFQTPVIAERMDKLLNETKGNWNEKVVRKYLGDEKVQSIKLVDYGF